jgi:hypothetical protein
VVFISILRKNIYLFTLLISGLTLYTIYIYVTSLINGRISRGKVSTKIDLYCKYPFDSNIFIVYLIILPFVDQYEFIYNMNAIIWVIIFTLMGIQNKFNFKKGIVFKEGIILDDGNLYRFDYVKKYEIKHSDKGFKYRDLVLTYKDNKIKTVYIYKYDIEEFKGLLEFN